MRHSNYVEVIREKNCTIADFAIEGDTRKERALYDLFAVFNDLHLDYEYVKAKITLGNFSKTVEVGFYLPAFNRYIAFPSLSARITQDKDSIEFTSFYEDVISRIFQDKKFYTGLDLFTLKMN